MSMAANMRQPRKTGPSGVRSPARNSRGPGNRDVAGRNTIPIWTTDTELFLLFSYILKVEGFATSLACSTNDVLASCTNGSPPAIILDCAHEALDVVSLCRKLGRSSWGKEIRLIALLQAGAQALHLALLQAGVDDCIVRPLSPERLLMSLRQAGAIKVETRVSMMAETPVWAGLEIDIDSRHVRYEGQDVVLPPIELKILCYLIKRLGQLCSRSELIASAWPPSGKVTPRTVDVHIGRLRKALKNGIGRDDIRTVHAAGYVLDLPPEAATSSPFFMGPR
jgi:two-component system phosphate regulon response regulator PhoB